MNTPRGGVGSVALGVKAWGKNQSFILSIRRFHSQHVVDCTFSLELHVRSWRKWWRGITFQCGEVQSPPQQVDGGVWNGPAARREWRQQTQWLPLRCWWEKCGVSSTLAGLCNVAGSHKQQIWEMQLRCTESSPFWCTLITCFGFTPFSFIHKGLSWDKSSCFVKLFWSLIHRLGFYCRVWS